MESLRKKPKKSDNRVDSEVNNYTRVEAVNAIGVSVQNSIPVDIEEKLQATIIIKPPMVTTSVDNMEPLDLSCNRQSNTNISGSIPDRLQTNGNECRSASTSENVEISTNSVLNKNYHAEVNMDDRKRDRVDTVAQAKGPFTGLVNHGVNCYINTLLQCLFMTPEFRDIVISWKSEILSPGTFVYELKQLFINLKEAGHETLDLRNLINTVTWFSKYEQQDLLELWHIVLDNFECAFRNRDEWLNIRSLFQGLLMSYVKCVTCGNVTKTFDSFYDLSLDVKASGHVYKNINESLAAFIKPDLLSGSNQYNCSICKKKSDALKGLALIRLPYILLLHLKRFEFLETHGRKLNDEVTYPDYLNLEPFMKENEFIFKQNISDQDGHKFEYTEDEYTYELYFVVLHYGNARAGHFSAYVKSLETKKWFMFNDRGVHEMTSDVWNHAYGGNGAVNNDRGCAYVLGYRQVNSNKNISTVESVITPVRHNQPEDLQVCKSVKRSFDYYVDTETSAGIKATVYCFLEDNNPASNVVKVTYNSETTIRMLKVTAIAKFLINIVTFDQYSIVKYNPVTKVVECSCDDDLLVAEYYNSTFALELNTNPYNNIPFTHVQLKLYKLDALIGMVSLDLEVTTSKDTTTSELVDAISNHNGTNTNASIVIDTKNEVAQVMPYNSESVLTYLDMAKSRYYVVDDAVIPKDVEFFKSDFGKVIRSMKRCIHVTLRYTKPDQCNLPNSAKIVEKASINQGVFYSWPSAATEIDGYDHIGITVELNSDIANLYNNVAKLIGVDEQFLDLYVLDVSHMNGEGQKLKCGSMTLKNALSKLNMTSYTATYEIHAVITSNAVVIVYLLDLQDSPEMKYKVKFRIPLPCTIGQCKQIARTLFQDKYDVNLKNDSCRLRKISQVGVTTVYHDSQIIDNFMSSFDSPYYHFCLQNVPKGHKLYSRLPDSLHLFAGRYRPDMNTLGPIHDMFLQENSAEEFINIVSARTGIPKENLLINITKIHLPCSPTKICNPLLDSWLSAHSRMSTWKNKIMYDGKVVYYKDGREDHGQKFESETT